MAGRMYMGLMDREQWVPACQVSPDFSSVGWQAKSQGLNGGATIKSSFSSHKEYSMTWGLNPRAAFSPIKRMASGIDGTGLVYFLDPFALDMNALPAQWAFPGSAALDGPVLIGNTRPSAIVDTVPNTLDYPAVSVAYDLTAASRSLYVPIPDGYTAWFGWHGASNGWGGVRLATRNRGTLGPTLFPLPLSVTDTTRFNTSISSASASGVTIDLAAAATGPALVPATDLYPSDLLYPASPAPATRVILSGLMMQILPTGVTPQAGGFIEGWGNSGCRFEQKPTETPYSTGLELTEYGMSAKLTEVGDWL
jgi:hypothetical protein